MGSRLSRTAGRSEGAQRGHERRHDPRLRRRRLQEGSISSGLFVDTLAVTGTRPSQAARLRVEDLHHHPSKPKLMMPKSGKGGGRNRSQKKLERYSVPITAALSKRLKVACDGRAAGAPPLRRTDGSPWATTLPLTIAAACASYRGHRREPRRGDDVQPSDPVRRPQVVEEHSDQVDRGPAQYIRRSGRKKLFQARHRAIDR